MVAIHGPAGAGKSHLAEVWRERSGALRLAASELAPEALPTLAQSALVLEDLDRGYRERVTDTHLPHIRDLPQVLPGLFADAAARAVEFVGLPEASLNLAEAVVHLSVAEKSNRWTVALGRAQADAREHPNAPVPPHLRDAHYRGASVIGHGEGYRYPHDNAGGWVDQEYRPDELEGHVYYEPSGEGAEGEVSERLRTRRQPGPSDRSEGDPAG